MNKTVKTTLVLFLIFICGIMIGVGGTLIMEKLLIKRVLENPAKARMMVVKRISRQCNLSASQRESIKSIIDDQAMEFAMLRNEIAPDIERVLESTHNNILDELDESQKIIFEKNYLKMIEKFRKTYYSYKKDDLRLKKDLSKSKELIDSEESENEESASPE